MAKYQFEREQGNYNQLTEDQLFSFWSDYQKKKDAVEAESAKYKQDHKWERSNPARTEFFRQQQDKISDIEYSQAIITEELIERGIFKDEKECARKLKNK